MQNTREKDEKLKPNPRATANPVSALTLWWTFNIFRKGYKRDLEEKDLYEPLNEHRSELLGEMLERLWYREVEHAERKKKKPSLLRVLTQAYGLKIAMYGLILFVLEVVIRVLQPLFLGQMIRYFSARDEMSEDNAYIYAGAVVLCSALNIIVIHPYMLATFHMGMKLRVALCSLIYRKALKLSTTALSETTPGQMVNLMSNDVNRFDVAISFLHYLWIGPLETFVVTYFIWNEVGISAVIGVASLLLFIPIQAYLGRRTSVLRLRTAIRTDERVRLMNEIISGIQVIKMYTWEEPFAKLVEASRRNEIRAIRASSYIRGILLSFIMFTTRISIFVTCVAYVLLKNELTAEKVFVITAFYQLLRQTMTVFFPQAIAQIAEAFVSIRRIKNFLCLEEQDVKVNEENKHTNATSVVILSTIYKDEKENCAKENHAKENEYENDGTLVKLDNVTAKWSKHGEENTLNKVCLDVKPGTLVAIIGTVGAGKTSLLHAILKELHVVEGKVLVKGSVSYASQEPWLFSASVRQNILFGQPYVRERYNHVIDVCALKRDFQLFPHGDKTIVGERGVSLSGGQRARINLARAVYKDADIYLLDDPLSAVDTHVGKHLFDDCITGYLKRKTVILVTHQLQYLKNADNIVIISNGSAIEQGTYDEIQSAKTVKLDEVLDESIDEESADESTPMKSVRQMSIRSTGSVMSLDEPDVAEVAEMRTKGTVGSRIYKAYFKAGGNCCVLFIMFSLFVLAQVSSSGSDYWITYWTNMEEVKWQQKNSNVTVDDYGITIFDIDICIYIYTALTAATIIVTLARSFTFFSVCMRASVNLHNSMFYRITHATMYFFNTNPSGRILNRFSKDMGSIDELLPNAMVDCLQIGLALLGIIIVVAVVNFWLMVPTFIIAAVFFLLRVIYITTSRSVKRLEGITRSPVFQHMNASLQGLTTIRAFGAQKELIGEFDHHQNIHSSAWYLFIASSRAFGFYLDIVCLFYILIVTLSFLVIGGEQFGGNVGLAITQAIGITGMFQWGMRQSAEVENQMTSVERVVEFTEVESEPPLESPPGKKPPAEWPKEGKIVFKDLSLKYSVDEPPVLKRLNFTVESKEKIGIVGRTGAGKSSLINALFRLTYLEGSIIIDGIDITTIGLHDLRRKLSIIPQEPVLFSGTMRKNLDPFDEYPDSALWNALEEVEMKEVVNELASGLYSKVSQGGSNFSVGQRQLVCLARAILRKNKILILDEATANVDPQTDELIQVTIRKKFVDCTVLTIAHRLHTVMDSDKVLVMDAGTVVEYDHPYVLLENTSSVFYGMVQQTGKDMVKSLTKKAKQSYNEKMARETT